MGGIKDNKAISDAQREDRLKRLFKKHGYTIKFVN